MKKIYLWPQMAVCHITSESLLASSLNGDSPTDIPNLGYGGNARPDDEAGVKGQTVEWPGWNE